MPDGTRAVAQETEGSTPESGPPEVRPRPVPPEDGEHAESADGECGRCTNCAGCKPAGALLGGAEAPPAS